MKNSTLNRRLFKLFAWAWEQIIKHICFNERIMAFLREHSFMIILAERQSGIFPQITEERTSYGPNILTFTGIAVNIFESLKSI